MRTIIAGSRTIEDYELVKQAISEAGFQITQVVSGGAVGVDKLGERYATENDIEIATHAPKEQYGKSAVFVANESKGKRADALIAVWDGKSIGTGHMINVAKRRGLLVYVKNLAEAPMTDDAIARDYPKAHNDMQG